MIRALLLCLALISPVAAQPTDGELAVALISGSKVWNVTPTGSMEPTFNETYVIFSKTLEWSDIRLGDVILYESPFAPIIICHRVVSRSSGGTIVLCKGDANSQWDPVFVTESMYRGTVIAGVKISAIKILVDIRR